MKRTDLTYVNGFTVHRERYGPFARLLAYRFDASTDEPHPVAPWVVWNVGPDGDLSSGGYYREYHEASNDFDSRDVSSRYSLAS